MARHAEVLARTLPVSSLSKCEQCEPGKFQDAEGQVACKPCKQGGYCIAGAAATALCPAGTYGSAEHATDEATGCIGCQSGMPRPSNPDPNPNPSH